LACILFAGCSGEQPARPATEEEIKAELKQLEGKWGGSSSLTEGQQSSSFQLVFFDFNGDALIMQDMNVVQRADAKVKVDPKASPKTMDIVLDKRTRPCIYKLEGDQLTICWGIDKDSARPKEFTGEKGTKQQLMTFKRFHRVGGSAP
jgi:uncharacterized protein (TIGR03067 family)